MATLHTEEPQHGAGQETHVTKEDIKQETRRLEQEVLASQQRSLATLGAAETVAADTLEQLAQQNEVIDGITVNLDAMENDLVYADMILKKIASPFAFMNMKTQGKAFETKFGKTADWSGPLGLKRSILPGFKKFYFVILEGRFMYFKGSGVKLSAASFDAARGTIALKCARIKTDKAKREIIVNSGSSKWHLQCSDDSDFFGWSTMLQQFASGKRLERKRAKGLASVKEANATPVEESDPLPSSATAPSPAHAQSQSLFSAQQQLQQQQQQLLQRQQQQEEEEQKAAQGKDANSFEDIMDKNFDLMMQKMENLGAMALEQQNAINVQNGKLEQAHEAVQDRNASLTTLQRNHERRLK
ncbi:Oxysterol-binding protein 1 [Hondaea fermentalgiana]|uniref:Synaptosomal-associated protein 47 n=1 Tax=Hondaea fermentalgiana TaxID=2315210 RepID=A0A2R5GSA2_9STRA|nr:Oxysterol-binding protein 1 [Hondaea fermentalgiana]|eukprot:GBG31523.1 Oxysterol-binding protein 1 [Hondaea fermentalgiana]